MKTNTKVKLNKNIAERFENWAGTLKISIETALQFAFNRLNECDITEELDAKEKLKPGEEKYFQVNVDYEIWGRFKREIIPKKDMQIKEGLEIAMYLFIKYYDEKLSEVL